ncbi:MAG: hypothetical protein KIS94_00520 [Chitinophagales bacterium]|nr:hypothetical protein [Chitinophagales bacterium]
MCIAKNIRLIAAVVPATFLLCACSTAPEKVNIGTLSIKSTTSVSLKSYLPYSAARFSVAANNSEADTFCITPSKLDFTDYNALIKSIAPDSVTDAEKAMAIWKALHRWTAHSKALTDSKLPHDPLRLLNSFETGLCDDRNAALTQLFRLGGLQARLQHLSGHLVAEVFYDAQWHMFDADWGVYFQNNQHEIASVDYISKNPECVNATYGNGAYGYLMNTLGNAYLRWVYSTVDDNSINTWLIDMPLNYTNAIVLGKSDSLVFEMKQLNRYKRWTQVFFSHTLVQYARKGTLYRCSSVWNTRKVSENEFVFSESLPYAITKVQVRLTEGSGAVYYSPDSVHWYFKGALSNGKGKLVFDAADEENNQGVFRYRLKVVTTEQSKTTPAISVKNNFLFSRKLFLNPEKSFKIVGLQKEELSLKLGITVQK